MCPYPSLQTLKTTITLSLMYLIVQANSMAFKKTCYFEIIEERLQTQSYL